MKAVLFLALAVGLASPALAGSNRRQPAAQPESLAYICDGDAFLYWDGWDQEPEKATSSQNVTIDNNFRFMTAMTGTVTVPAQRRPEAVTFAANVPSSPRIGEPLSMPINVEGRLTQQGDFTIWAKLSPQQGKLLFRGVCKR